MTEEKGVRSRREMLTGAAGIGAAGVGLALLAGAPRADAAAMSDTEKANLKLVNDFCAVWPTQDAAKVMGFFSDNPAYRVNETSPPAVGLEAVTQRITGLTKVAAKFEVHDSWTRGPMVINERTDYFNGGRLKSWRGVGVFLVQGGKIVEWYDYTIERIMA